MLMWGAGAATNIQADYHLISLRSTGGKGYHIPRAGLCKLVTGANFMGEILEWLGYAIACNHLGAYAFAWLTVCNLAPRALRNHADNQRRFGLQYPAHRRALIPFVL